MEDAATAKGRPPSQVARMLIAAAALTLMWAMLCNFVLELLQLLASQSVSVSGAFVDNWKISLLNAGVTWAVLLLIVCLTGRLWVSVALVTLATLIVGFANYEKISIRREPLYPSDLAFAGEPGFLTHMVTFGTIAMAVGLSALVMLVVVLAARILSRRFRRVRRRELPRLWIGMVTCRVVGIVLLAAGLWYTAHFNTPGNRVREAYQDAGAHWAFWYQTLNYEENGFVGGVLYNLEGPAMDKPADYNAATMHRIVAKYTALAAQMNSGRDPHALDHVNVVAILSEAFSDPTRLHGVTLAQDPIPFTRNLLAHTTSGNMLAQLYGGGTANMEFETLTGMSLSQFQPQMTTPYQMLIPRYQQFPSAVGYFKDHGHEPIGIHPYMTSMYKRNEVYPILGFDKFIHDTTMQQAKKLEKSDFISDASAFHEADYQIAHSRKPLFINLVTMQNHYPMADEYAHPIHVTGVSGEDEAEAGGYARGINYTDEALKSFLTTLTHSNEKTVVVFYGDHLPAVWPTSIYKQNGDRRMKETPFFVWSNFSPNRHRPLPTTSPIYFMPKVFDAANATLPPYYALLEQLEKRIPAMEQGMYIDPQNRLISEKQLSPRAREVLHDYRLVQYDLSVGQRYSQAGLFYPSAQTASAQAAGQ